MTTKTPVQNLDVLARGRDGPRCSSRSESLYRFHGTACQSVALGVVDVFIVVCVHSGILVAGVVAIIDIVVIIMFVVHAIVFAIVSTVVQI